MTTTTRLPGTNITDMHGQRFGRLTVIRHVGRGQWECRCDCGEVCIKPGGRLRCGGVRSCGCLGLEVQARWGETRRQRFIETLRAEGWTITPPIADLEVLAAGGIY